VVVALINFLPMSLAMKKVAKRYEQRRQHEKSKLVGITEDIAEEIDMFRRDRIISPLNLTIQVLK
jgi:hypothetical protein